MAVPGTQIRFTLDGSGAITSDKSQQAAILLRLAGRDPAHFDLVHIDKRGVETLFRDSELVHIRPGDIFATVPSTVG